MKNLIYIVSCFCLISVYQLSAQTDKPNILLITLDDMNWDSPGVYGGIIPDLTPNIDQLAKKGVLFRNAYVQAPNCSPSRVVIQTGLYPHQTGMRGFYFVKDNFNTLPEILKSDGYFTGVLNKPADTSLNPDYDQYWDESNSIPGTKKRSAKMYSNLFSKFLNKAYKNEKPFYCVVNVADPHKPFFNDPASIKNGFDDFKPSKIYTEKDIEIPEFLPKNKKIKKEVLNYYNSVKRGDDCVGEIINTLQKSKFSKNTIVILLSDHGAPFPFAKSSVYQNGIKTPLIVSFPLKFSNAVDDRSTISSIDIAPTILEMTGNKVPKNLPGTSFYGVLTQKKESVGKYVFAQFDENAGGTPRPSRTVITKRYGYIFNPWATGSYLFKSASSYHASYKAMTKMSKTNEEVNKRFNHWKFRTIEEFYDYEKDPHALKNLVKDPAYQEIIATLRSQLSKHMKATDDYVLPAFEKREDINFLNAWMQKEIISSQERQKTIRWKRYKNAHGKTKQNKKLFDNSTRK